jgi:ATP phosphoribosyltransferase
MSRLTLAIPSKGRLREPSWSLLEASGLAPQEPGERVLMATCLYAEVDILFVRADDVPEYVRDGVVDCGITGLDLVAESELPVDELLRLNFGACSLRAAVPVESSVSSLSDLQGTRIATSHPNLASRALRAQGVNAEVVAVTGSAEIAPRLGLADAIIDLVSSGSTLRTNGLRPIATVFDSEAVLIGRRDDQSSIRRSTLVTMLGSVVAGPCQSLPDVQRSRRRTRRGHCVAAHRGLSERDAARERGIVALHALIPAASVWSLLPQLRVPWSYVDSDAPR